MKIYNRFCALALSGVLMLSMAACGDPGQNPDKESEITDIPSASSSADEGYLNKKPKTYGDGTEFWLDVSLLDNRYLVGNLGNSHVVLTVNGEEVRHTESPQTYTIWGDKLITSGFGEVYDNNMDRICDGKEKFPFNTRDINGTSYTTMKPEEKIISSSYHDDKTDKNVFLVIDPDTMKTLYEFEYDRENSSPMLVFDGKQYLIQDMHQPDPTKRYITFDGEYVQPAMYVEGGNPFYFLEKDWLPDSGYYLPENNLPYTLRQNEGFDCIGHFPFLMDLGPDQKGFGTGETRLVKLLNYETKEPVTETLYTNFLLPSTSKADGEQNNDFRNTIFYAYTETGTDLYNTKGELIYQVEGKAEPYDKKFQFNEDHIAVIKITQDAGSKIIFFDLEKNEPYYEIADKNSVKNISVFALYTYRIAMADGSVFYLFKNGTTRDDIEIHTEAASITNRCRESECHYFMAHDLNNPDQMITVNSLTGTTIGTFKVNMAPNRSLSYLENYQIDLS